jgi:histidinol-phosphate aminotransferase
MSDGTVEHGGPDAGPAIHWDFSTNANPLPLPDALVLALQTADRRRYPDPAYAALRAHLAAQWTCEPDGVHITAGSSEAIRRLTLAASLQGVRQVWVPEPGYGDYRAAAEALGMTVWGWRDELALCEAVQRLGHHGEPVLCWLCDPCNPTGASLAADTTQALVAALDAGVPLVVALDRAYTPLRLRGEDPVVTRCASRFWQLWSPNKALGVTGVRAGAMQAPGQPHDLATPSWQLGVARSVAALAPSWVLSAEGVALLQAWHTEPVQSWLADARLTLAEWAAMQKAMLTERGWHCASSDTPFFLATPPWLHHRATEEAGLDWSAQLNTGLRARGIRLRDATGFGLPGVFRLSVQAPVAQRVLRDALASWRPNQHDTHRPVDKDRPA